MSTTIPNFNSNKVVSNLDTYVYTVINAGNHVAKIRVTVIPTSGMSILIKQNSSTIVTSTTPTTAQGDIELSCTINASVNDTISFVLSSSNANDVNINTFKAILDVHQGSNN